MTLNRLLNGVEPTPRLLKPFKSLSKATWRCISLASCRCCSTKPWKPRSPLLGGLGEPRLRMDGQRSASAPQVPPVSAGPVDGTGDCDFGGVSRRRRARSRSRVFRMPFSSRQGSSRLRTLRQSGQEGHRSRVFFMVRPAGSDNRTTLPRSTAIRRYNTRWQRPPLPACRNEMTRTSPASTLAHRLAVMRKSRQPSAKWLLVALA